MKNEKAEMTVTITMKQYTELLNDSRILAMLEAYGVDNWEGYALAMAELDD